MRIKEAAVQSGLTEKAIRLYEERGLIAPDITEHGGRKFRDYHDDTVRTLKTIAVLRQFSFSLEQISGMQTCPAEIPAIFSRYREELHTRHETYTALISRADAVAPEALNSIDELSDHTRWEVF